MAGRTFKPFDEIRRSSGSAVNNIIELADKHAAQTAALTEISQLLDELRPNAQIPSRRIRQILRKHGISASTGDSPPTK